MSISTMPMTGDCDNLENLSITGLVPLLRCVETLEAENAALKEENASLREQPRAAKRPAALFSKIQALALRKSQAVPREKTGLKDGGSR